MDKIQQSGKSCVNNMILYYFPRLENILLRSLVIAHKPIASYSYFYYV